MRDLEKICTMYVIMQMQVASMTLDLSKQNSTRFRIRFEAWQFLVTRQISHFIYLEMTTELIHDRCKIIS